jgi:RB1-inducible coiled-coil protein 1
MCENEIHAQHLQHQGWAAALANLEDSVLALEKRKTSFEDTYGRYLIKRDHYKLVIETFDDDIHILSKIPVLTSLMTSTTSKDSMNDSDSKATSLLDWINQAGNSSLEQVADSCYRSLEQLDEPFLDNLKGKVNSCVEAAKNQQMKEIRGLGDRLSGLEQLLLEATKKVVEQKDLANAFLQVERISLFILYSKHKFHT